MKFARHKGHLSRLWEKKQKRNILAKKIKINRTSSDDRWESSRRNDGITQYGTKSQNNTPLGLRDSLKSLRSLDSCSSKSRKLSCGSKRSSSENDCPGRKPSYKSMKSRLQLAWRNKNKCLSSKKTEHKKPRALACLLKKTLPSQNLLCFELESPNKVIENCPWIPSWEQKAGSEKENRDMLMMFARKGHYLITVKLTKKKRNTFLGVRSWRYEVVYRVYQSGPLLVWLFDSKL